MNTLAFEFTPSTASNDHQARIRIDDADWLGNEYLGIDPPEFFAQASLASGGELLVGRCECGCVGCDDVRVQVSRTDSEVLWSNGRGLHLHFDATEYDSVVASARTDYSWEDTRRTAERLVSSVFAAVAPTDGYIFDWASARCREGVMVLSFSKQGEQKLIDFPWDGRTPEEALERARRFCSENFACPGTVE